MEARKTQLASMAADAMRRAGAVMAPAQAVEAVRDALSAETGATVTDSEMLAVLVLAARTGLSPTAGDIRLYPSYSGTGLAAVVTVDGWIRVINAHPALAGIQFYQSPDRVMVDGKLAHEWCECSIYRKDRTVPTTVREYLEDCIEHGDPAWAMPNRQLRNRAMVQAARIALGLSCDDVPVLVGMQGEAAGATSATAVARMVELDAGEAMQTVSAPAVASAPEQTAGRPQRARRAKAPAQQVEGVVLDAQETLLPADLPAQQAAAPDQPAAPAVAADTSPPATPASIGRVAAKLTAFYADDAKGYAAVLAQAGVAAVGPSMTTSEVERITALLDSLQ